LTGVGALTPALYRVREREKDAAPLSGFRERE
jgi:hypothetical protein